MAKILIIDDDEDIIMAVRMSLESAGHEMCEAHSGEEGLEMIKAEHPEMLILDVMMETDTAGIDVARKLRNPDPASGLEPFSRIPILMLTGMHTATPIGDDDEINAIPVDLYVDKPIDPDDLIGKVDWVLSQQVF